MKTLITYFSKTGNTEQLARHIAAVLRKRGLEYDLRPIKELDPSSLAGCDLLFVGAPCYGGDLAPPAKKLLATIAGLEGKQRLFVFTTHSTEASGPYYDRWAAGCESSYRAALSKSRCEGAGFFHCKGRPSKAIALFIQFVVFRGDKPGWEKFKPDMYNHPDTKDLAKLEKAVERLFQP